MASSATPKVSRRTRNGIHADAAYDESEAGRYAAAYDGIAGNGRHTDESEKTEAYVFYRGELERQTGKHGSKEQKHYAGGYAAYEGTAGGNAEGSARLTLFGHGIAVECRSRVAGGPGSIHENGGNTPGKVASAVYAEQKAHGGFKTYTVGQRCDYGHTGRGRKAGSRTEYHADNDSQSDEADDRGGTGHAESGKEVSK